MVEKVNVVRPSYKTGDLLEVLRKDGQKFTCIVVENLSGGIVSKVLSKDEGVGTASWNRYDLKKDGRFQLFSECASIKKLASAKKFTANSTLTLNESVQRDTLTYYETPLKDGRKVLFCINEGFGGWSVFSTEKQKAQALKESFLGMQISEIKSQTESE